MKRALRAAVLATALSATLLAQAPPFGNAVRAFIKVDAPVVALTNVRVITKITKAFVVFVIFVNFVW